jgi:hypothetical protein
VKRCVRVIVGALLSAAAFAAQAAITYSFQCINPTDPNCSIGSSQLKLTVSDGSNGITNFRFTNTGPLSSSITAIYFDWLSPHFSLTPGTITESSGVSFNWGPTTPPDLPGGKSIGFVADLGLDTNVPTSPNGINPGEWLNIAFAGSFDQLVQGLHSNSLEVGMQVQSFPNGNSASFATLPEPAVYALLLFSIPLFGFALRRRKLARIRA